MPIVETMTVADVAFERGITSRTVMNWIKVGRFGGQIKLKALKVGQSWEIDPRDLAAFDRRVTRAWLKGAKS